MKKRDFTRDSTDIKVIIRTHHEKPYANKFDSLDEMTNSSSKTKAHSETAYKYLFICYRNCICNKKPSNNKNKRQAQTGSLVILPI